MLRKILLGFTSFLSLALLIVIAAVAYLHFADLNRYKPQISQRLTEYLGRQVDLAGDFNIKILPPSLSLNDANIANASWGSTPTMLSVQQLDMQIELLPLLSGKLLISKFRLNDVQVVVEHNEQGDNNWPLFESNVEKPKAKPSQQPDALLLDFASDANIDIRNIKLSYRQSPGSQRREFILNTATIRGLGKLDTLQINFTGLIDNQSYQIMGKIGSLANLLSADKSFPLDLQAHALNTDWKIKGEIKNVLKLERLQINAKASAKDLTAWQQWLGVSIEKGPININADIAGDLNKLSVTKLVAQIGHAVANGDMSLDMSSGKPAIYAAMNIKDVHINEFLDAIRREPAEQSGHVTQVEKPEPGNKTLDLSFLNQFDSDVVLSLSSVSFQEWGVDQLNAELKVKDGQFSAVPFSIASPLGQANGEFMLANDKGIGVANLKIDAKDLALGKFFDISSTYQGIGALQGSIHSKGKSWTDLYANLQGNATAHYANKEHKHDTRISLRRSELKTSATPFDVVIDGELKKVPYKIIGEIGGPMALIDDQPYPATAHLTFLNVDANAKGTIAKLFQAKGFDIHFDARTDDLGKVNKKIDMGLPDLKKTQVKAVFRGDYSLLKFDDIKAKSNNLNLSGDVQVSFQEPLPKISGDISVQKFDLTGIQQEIVHADKAASSSKVKNEKSVASALKKSISFSALQAFNMNINLNANADDKINIPHFLVASFNTQISVVNSELSISQINLKSSMGEVSASLKIDAKNKVPIVEARLISSNFDLEQFEVGDEEKNLWQALVGADVALQTQGDSLQEWLESISGTATINYQHKQKPQTFVVRLAREAQLNTLASPVSVRVNSKINETILQGSGSVSAPHTWLIAGEPTVLDFSASSKGFAGEVRGKIDDILTGDGMDMRVTVDNKQALTALFDPNDLANKIGKLQLVLQIKGNYSNIVSSQISGIIGEGKISGSTIVNSRERPIAVEFNFDIDGLDISEWAATDRATKETTAPRTKEGKLFSSEKLPFHWFQNVSTKGTVKGDNIQFRRVKAKNFDTAIELRDGVLQFKISRLETKDGVLYADLNIDANSVPPNVSLKLDVPKLNMSEFARNTQAEGLVRGNFSADISLSSVGDSIAELAAGLDGHVRLLMDKGSIDSALLNIYTGGVSAMVGMLTAADVKSTRVNCGICGLRFTKGKAVSEVVLLDTQYSTLVAEGWVNLANETLSVKASPVKKGLRLNMELPVVVQGELSDPKVSTQPTSALNTAAEIATVWFIPTTAIFIGYDALRSGDKNPCVNMMAPTKEGAALRALKGAGKAVGDIGSIFSKGLSALLGGGIEERPQEDNAPE